MRLKTCTIALGVSSVCLLLFFSIYTKQDYTLIGSYRKAWTGAITREDTKKQVSENQQTTLTLRHQSPKTDHKQDALSQESPKLPEIQEKVDGLHTTQVAQSPQSQDEEPISQTEGGIQETPTITADSEVDNKNDIVSNDVDLKTDGDEAEKLAESTMEYTTNSPLNSDVIDPTQGTVKVILLTYMRSGSSFTGDLLQQHPQVFYVYEPLWSVVKNHVRDPDPVKDRESLTSNGIFTMDAYLNCRFDDIDLKTLSIYHLFSSHSTTPYSSCLHRNLRINGTKLSRNLVNYCLHKTGTRNRCEQARVKAIKVIRATMRQALKLITSDPDIKVIHLIRDPRGGLKSQSRVGNFRWGGLEDAARKYCDRVMLDIQLSTAISRRYPRRILTVRYEDIVASPVEATRQMYEFINLRMQGKIEKYIWNITYGGLPDNCNICTTRTNATETAYRWRTLLHIQEVDIIQKHCGVLMNTMGYLPISSSEDLKNMAIPVLKKTYSEHLMSVNVYELGDSKNVQ